MSTTALPQDKAILRTPHPRIPERTSTNLGRLERWGSIALGSALLAYGLSRTLRVRRPIKQDTRDALGGERGFRVMESIRIDRPLHQIFAFWRRLENLPRFMAHLERVVDLGNGHSHWVAKGPAGMQVEWDAEIINEVPDKVIGWQSLRGADLVTAGSVNFDTMDGGRSTQITIHLQYAPPGGRLGKLVAQLFGDEPSQAIREDLRRLKRLLESPDAT